jgi:gliding motility-associated lipoprotein GldD
MRGALFIILLLACISCGVDIVEQPKPRAFPKIEFPERGIDTFRNETCPFTFQHHSYFKQVKDTLFFDEKPVHPCWFDLRAKAFNGQLHFSYFPIENQKHFDKLVADAFKLSGKHNVKADYIDEMVFKNGADVSGVIFDMQGPVASPFQFYVTDSTQHFLRASLYINAKTKPDSLQPIYDYIKKDIALILNSFEWK